MKKLHLITLLATAVASFSASKAAIIIGGFSFDDNAFADTLISSSGTFTTSGGTLNSVLTDKNPGTFAYSFTPSAFVELGFTDNLLVNGSGADLVLFELGDVDALKVSIGGVIRTYATAFTGQTAGGFNLNAVGIDLNDFGIANGATLNSIVIGMDIENARGTVPSLSLAGALNTVAPRHSVPDSGSSIGLLLVGSLALAGMRRRLRTRA